MVAIDVSPFTFVEKLCSFGFAFTITVLAGDVVGSRFGVAGVAIAHARPKCRALDLIYIRLLCTNKTATTANSLLSVGNNGVPGIIAPVKPTDEIVAACT